MRCLAFIFSIFVCVSSFAQGYSIYQNSQFDPFQREMYKVGIRTLHSSLRQYKLDEIRSFYDLDSLIYAGIRRPDVYLNPREAEGGKPVCGNVFKNFIHDDFLAWKYKDIYVAINPYCEFQVGHDSESDHTTYTNTRGMYVNGSLGKNFWFYLDLTENNMRYPAYYEEICNDLLTVPGVSTYKYKNGYYDFEMSDGFIGFNIGKYIDFQLGKSKVFIGDGYRSLLLSDAACSYPMFKFNMTFLGFKYMMMIAQLQTHDAQEVHNNGHRIKYSFTHYFDWNLFGRWSLGLFENVTQAAWRITGESRSIDFEYLNPFVIFRAGEYHTGSPDKMIVGLNTKVVVCNGLTLHGQIMFNEFILKELTSGNDFWANKYAFLVGLKSVDLFGCPGLDFQAEYSMARPYCYSQYVGMANYTHQCQSLAHPLGANFKEFVSILNYRYKRLMLRGQFNYAKFGGDIPGDEANYGHDPNRSSNDRNANYGIKMLQGSLCKLVYGDVAASVLINPRNMLNFTVGFRSRTLDGEHGQSGDSKHIYFALRWSLKNQYYDL